MPDTAIPDLDSIAGAAVLDADGLALTAVAEGKDRFLPIPEALIALQARGAVKFVIGEPADAVLNGGECYLWLDNTASPQTLNIKVKDTSSPEVIFKSVL